MGKAQRRHDRDRVVKNRIKFVLNNWSVYQPGINYGDIKWGEGTWRWFTPGRFDKIHPARVCSCSFCRGERDHHKKERK